MKPRIKKVGALWICYVQDAKGVVRQFAGHTVAQAWASYQETLKRLERLGMRWEIFP